MDKDEIKDTSKGCLGILLVISLIGGCVYYNDSQREKSKEKEQKEAQLKQLKDSIENLNATKKIESYLNAISIKEDAFIWERPYYGGVSTLYIKRGVLKHNNKALIECEYEIKDFDIIDSVLYATLLSDDDIFSLRIEEPQIELIKKYTDDNVENAKIYLLVSIDNLKTGLFKLSSETSKSYDDESEAITDCESYIAVDVELNRITTGKLLKIYEYKE